MTIKQILTALETAKKQLTKVHDALDGNEDIRSRIELHSKKPDPPTSGGPVRAVWHTGDTGVLAQVEGAVNQTEIVRQRVAKAVKASELK